MTILYPYRLNQMVSKENRVKVKRDIDQEAIRKFEKISHLLDGSNIEFDFRSEVGFLNDRIQEHLHDGDIKLIVMGMNLAAEGGEALNELVQHLKVPLVVVPEGESIAF